MKAKELRVGNYFKWSTFASMGIGEDIITEKNHYRHNQLREPITLTEGWLIKFGFENVGDAEYPNYKKGYHTCMVRKHGINICNNHGFVNDIKHVHQLQNLYFTLTGEELIIAK